MSLSQNGIVIQNTDMCNTVVFIISKDMVTDKEIFSKSEKLNIARHTQLSVMPFIWLYG